MFKKISFRDLPFILFRISTSQCCLCQSVNQCFISCLLSVFSLEGRPLASHLWALYEYTMHNMVHDSHTSEHLKSTLYTIWCRIVTSLSTVWVHHAQYGAKLSHLYGAKLSHLWASYEYIMQNMVQNCHILRASYEYIMRRMFTPPSTLWIHHAPYGAEFSTIVDTTQRTKK